MLVDYQNNTIDSFGKYGLNQSYEDGKNERIEGHDHMGFVIPEPNPQP